jgi:hypothetical protein
MHKFLISLLFALILLLNVSTRRALAQAEGEELTVKGEIVDLSCYLPRGERGRGAAHQECAEMCAKGGLPLGVLDAGGQVLLLLEDHEKPASYGDVKKLAGQQAEVSGKKITRGGLSGIVVSAVKKP